MGTPKDYCWKENQVFRTVAWMQSNLYSLSLSPSLFSFFLHFTLNIDKRKQTEALNSTQRQQQQQQLNLQTAHTRKNALPKCAHNTYIHAHNKVKIYCRELVWFQEIKSPSLTVVQETNPRWSVPSQWTSELPRHAPKEIDAIRFYCRNICWWDFGQYRPFYLKRRQSRKSTVEAVSLRDLS